MRALIQLIATNQRTIITTLVSLFLSISFVELLGMLGIAGLLSYELLASLMVFLYFLAIPLSLYSAISHVIMRTLRGTTRTIQLGSVLLSYVSVILSFAGYYYFQSSVCDYNDTVSEYRYYETLRGNSFKQILDQKAESLRRETSDRAFKGISASMWNGLQSKIIDWPAGAGVPPVEKLLAPTKRPIIDIISFNHSAKIPVFLDCLYFSTITITSTGFGDISPSNIYIKIAVMLETLSGVLLVAVGIAIAVGGVNPEKNNPHKE